MSDEHAKGPFNDAVQNNQNKKKTSNLEKGTIRDKDNAAPRVKPPQNARYPQPDLAPRGMSGIKTRTQENTHAKRQKIGQQTQQAKEQTRAQQPKQQFKIGEKNKLQQEFKPASRKVGEKDKAPQPQKSKQATQRYKIGEGGKLKQEFNEQANKAPENRQKIDSGKGDNKDFKPLAKPSPDKGKGIER